MYMHTKCTCMYNACTIAMGDSQVIDSSIPITKFQVSSTGSGIDYFDSK